MARKQTKTTAWVISVSMGYGHQRTANPLRDVAPQAKIICANDYEGIPEGDKKIWQNSREFYEFMSNFKRTPLIGSFSFYIFDQFQKILSFYPKRDLSKPTLILKKIFDLIRGGWGKHLIETLSQNPLPFVTSFFTPAFMAETHGYPNEIYCIICDADISRAWAPLLPQKSKIKYFAPTERVVERLKLYGVREENVFLTGYPLPKENLGGEELKIAKSDLGQRLVNLDPQGLYREKHAPLIKENVGRLPKNAAYPLTILFSIGGAGAQKEIGLQALKSLTNKLKNKQLKFIFSAGTKTEVKDYFVEAIKSLELKQYLGKNIEIIYDAAINGYFQKFNTALRTTDILWTKPSELSFYSALGIPTIIAPPIGSQEYFNRDWLLQIGAGIPQGNPAHADEWLFDLLKAGQFAKAAMEGFIEGEKYGTYKIEKIISQNQK